MSLNFGKHTKTAKLRLTTTRTWLTYSLLMVIILSIFAFGPTPAQADEEEAFEETTVTTTNDQYDLDGYLETQTVLIETLREYIKKLQQKIEVIKSKTNEIKAINDIAQTDVHKYVSNPLNALTILKRFTTDWHSLRQFAENVYSTTEIVKNLTNSRKSLKFPSESDFDEAANNVLRIQGIYQLEPERLAQGEVNGVKLGSSMSWSDCLEIGRKSVQNGDFMIAKFWMNVALGKLPAVEMMKALTMTNDTEVLSQEPSGGSNAVVESARFEIMEELMATEISMGNLDVALDIVNEMLQLYPKNKNLIKAKAKIEKKLQKAQRNSKQKEKAKQKKKESKVRSDKSVEELLIEQICRETANIGIASTTSSHTTVNSRTQDCRLVNGNLPELTLQPLEVELLSLDPYIVIYHNVLRAQEINDLQRLVDQEEKEQETYEDELTAASKQFKFTKLAQKKLSTSLAKRLQLATGHASADFNQWRVQRWTYENDVNTEPLLSMTTQTLANVLFNLHTSKLGGGIVFPQLEMGVMLPANALLYWTQLNEYHEYDYRSKQHVCPVVAGVQLTAFTSVRA